MAAPSTSGARPRPRRRRASATDTRSDRRARAAAGDGCEHQQAAVAGRPWRRPRCLTDRQVKDAAHRSAQRFPPRSAVCRARARPSPRAHQPPEWRCRRCRILHAHQAETTGVRCGHAFAAVVVPLGECDDATGIGPGFGSSTPRCLHAVAPDALRATSWDARPSVRTTRSDAGVERFVSRCSHRAGRDPIVFAGARHRRTTVLAAGDARQGARAR